MYVHVSNHLAIPANTDIISLMNAYSRIFENYIKKSTRIVVNDMNKSKFLHAHTPYTQICIHTNKHAIIHTYKNG
jgi:hypothetical protein